MKACMKGVVREIRQIRVNCGVVEWEKRNTLRWFGHIEKMGSEEFMKNVYLCE